MPAPLIDVNAENLRPGDLIGSDRVESRHLMPRHVDVVVTTSSGEPTIRSFDSGTVVKVRRPAWDLTSGLLARNPGYTPRPVGETVEPDPAPAHDEYATRRAERRDDPVRD